MKKRNITLFFSLIFALAIIPTKVNGGVNPIVNRLPAAEVLANKTPAAVAYNFVLAILQYDEDKIESFMDDESLYYITQYMQEYDKANYIEFFSTPGKLNILGWKLLLKKGGYEVAVLYVQDEGTDDNGNVIKKVYVDCIPSTEIGNTGFQDVTRSGETNVKVLLTWKSGRWVFIGFK